MTEPTVFSGKRQRPLAEVRQRAARLAAGLRGLGIGPGGRYAIIMRNEIAFLEANLAASPIGAVPVTVNWHWTGTDLAHLLSDSGITLAIVHTDLLPAVEARKPEHVALIEAETPEEVAAAYGLGPVPLTGRHPVLADLIEDNDPVSGTAAAPPLGVLYTSGTTGQAKGLLRDPVDPARAGELAALIGGTFGYEPAATTVIPAPLYHLAPNAAATFAAAAGMSLVLMPRFDAEELLRLIDRHRVSTVQVVPTMFTRMLRLPEEVRGRYDLSSLRAVVHAAAPCPPDVKRAVIDWLGPIVREYYGGSEGGIWTYCDTGEWLTPPGTVGRPVDGAAIRVLDPGLKEVPAGETGLVYGRSPAAWPGFTYIGDAARRREIDGGDGFFTIGDIGHMDDDGYLYLSDRQSHMVISGGVNIYPAEIEACLASLDGVEDVAVFGIPDADLGETLAAHVQPAAGSALTEDQVRAHVARNLAKYKVPSVVVFEDELPREDSGKLFKRRLRERYLTG